MLEGWPPPVLDPAGPYAGSITTLSWALFALAAFVLLIVNIWRRGFTLPVLAVGLWALVAVVAMYSLGWHGWQRTHSLSRAGSP